MNKNYSDLQKIAKRIRRDLKKQINPDAIVKYLQNIGYSVIFFNDDSEYLNHDNLIEYSCDKNAFVFISQDLKAVYIRETLTSDEILRSLLHETSHILLGHLDERDVFRNKRKEEMEAETLAYSILNPQKNFGILKTIFLCIVIFLIGFTIPHITAVQNTTANDVAEPIHIQTQTAADAQTDEKVTETVYVTSSGTKYHRSDCRYIKEKNCNVYTREEAKTKYAPCSVCKP